MRTVCCVCMKMKVEKGWVKQVIAHNGRISHGYCPACFQQTMRKFDNYAAIRELEAVAAH